MRAGGAPSRLRHRVGAVLGHLWRPGARVLVAVSGGLDSTVLLDLLVATRAWHGGRLEVANVDHGHRPDGATEQARVLTWAAGLDLPVHALSLDLARHDEASMRLARYEALRAVGADVIALGHHADDQAETVLVHLLRGARPVGMGWVSEDRVRPLLAEPRSALLAWARHRGLVWVEDPTNTDETRLRNAVRARLRPEVDGIRPGAWSAIASAATPPLGPRLGVGPDGA